MGGLRNLPATDVRLVRDGGGKAPQLASARYEINGEPGAVFRDRDGKVADAWAVDREVKQARRQTR